MIKHNPIFQRTFVVEQQEHWRFAMIRPIAAPTEYMRKYWRMLKTRLIKEYNELAANYSQLTKSFNNGNFYLTSVSLISSIFSPTVPFKK